jgi:hypothetical protein
MSVRKYVTLATELSGLRDRAVDDDLALVFVSGQASHRLRRS